MSRGKLHAWIRFKDVRISRLDRLKLNSGADVEQKIINPWTWQDRAGFSQAIETTGGPKVLYCAGQTSVTADGNPIHTENMEAQILQALDNLETVLTAAGYSLSNVVRLNYYTTNVDYFLSCYQSAIARLQQANCRPASTLLGVERLANTALMIEIEATAVK